uniref:Uncharacterized protein n=1 Tax=Pseudictyota dubia TaxID=2749911 RepID=A0A7R9W351_9STRA|mmetsp:Transcript_31595/g.58216  ORF Transcript_31595/g.58216 Transcript_31595/m.58216 type:complete len:1517 (+) Transcript_31595:182-4732(+)|eukprot:CAMPEP_0197451354 /NCGR_PEP_ID=MMETSP1175-20131217/28559_1 /TAXON_ID=1003142 /ORGANISM="Triceratium dubium, Strain CCMP147" /LENGTH=1516 /DNA_ID=CAMNT_0042984049 /DNA_START=182 /DNA_END=4732 /DNA_ORIENTATION=-
MKLLKSVGVLHSFSIIVGLKGGTAASETDGTATKLNLGSEIFTDTVYAEPVVSQAAVNSHALIEGVRGRLRIQSDLISDNPEEYQFLDSNYHYGPAELIQLEQDPDTNKWGLAHYYHPLTPRKDGARTDGLVRHAIIGFNNILKNPTQVIAVTGNTANKFSAGRLGQTTTNSYLLFILDEGNAHFYVGQGSITALDPSNTPPSQDYPITWSQYTGDDLVLTGILSAEKYTSGGWNAAGNNVAPNYDPEMQVEHLVLYLAESIWVVTMVVSSDSPSLDFVFHQIENCPRCFVPEQPQWPADARLVHLDWDPTNVGEKDWLMLTNVVLASSSVANEDVTYTLYFTNSAEEDNDMSRIPSQFTPLAKALYAEYQGMWHTRSHTVSSSDLNGGEFIIDFSKIRFVHDLHTSWVGGNVAHVKLLAVEGKGVFLLTIAKEGAASVDNNEFYHVGHFPLALPDAAGLGSITGISGGTSKFNGWRFIVSDSDGNVFQLRQRRYSGANTPYAPPIYGTYTATGEVRTSWPTTQEAFPATTAQNSPLRQLDAWFKASTEISHAIYYNYFLNAALAFSTDDTSQSQAIWLGNNFVAAYAPKRYSMDSEHLEVKQTQSGEKNIYTSFMVFKNPVDKSWRERVIASQTLPKGPGLEEMGEHYQAILAPANDAGQIVSMQSVTNQNLAIEIRADSPCAVIDDTNNLYYDVDRYTSFFAKPNNSTGKLNLLVKAEGFSQILYARLVETSSLQPSSKDEAMLGGAPNNANFPWQTINIASQAQQRMGNTAEGMMAFAATTVIADTEVYISGDSLSKSNQETPWKTKGNYKPTASNLGSVATYLNTAGQNLLTDSSDLGLGAVGVDPLYAVTAVLNDPNRLTVTSSFGYADGVVDTTTDAPMELSTESPGSIWSSISHALHDALHWLQNVESKVYDELASNGVTIVSAVDSITVTVSKDIMQRVNGAVQDLKEVVSTVEEYATIAVNLIVTIVEHTFIYELIEILIALISLFFHLHDIQSLSKSLHGRFNDIVSGTNGQSLPNLGSFTVATEANKYLGLNTQANQAFDVDQSQVNEMVTEIVEDILSAVLKNPLTGKVLNKILSTLTQAVDEVLPTPPVTFDLDPTVMNTLVDDLSTLEEDVLNGVVSMTSNVAIDFTNEIAADIANPQAVFKNLQTGFSTLLEQVAADVLTPAFDFVDDLTAQAPIVTQSLFGQGSYLKINVSVIADLLNLLGIGSGNYDDFVLSPKDAVFFPVAIIAWVAVYAAEGKSISSVSDLEGTLSALRGCSTTIDTSRWNFVRLVVDGVLQELLGFAAIQKQAQNDDESSSAPSQSSLDAVAPWLGWMRWTNDFVYGVYSFSQAPSTDTVKDWDFANVLARFGTASLDVILKLPGKGLNPGDGWPSNPKRTDLTQFLNFILGSVSMCVDTFGTAFSNPDTYAIINIAGQNVQRTQGIGAFAFNVFKQELQEYDELFALWMLGAPAGFGVQAAAVKDKNAEPFNPGSSLASSQATRTYPLSFGLSIAIARVATANAA